MMYRRDLSRATLVATLAISGLVAACQSNDKPDNPPNEPMKSTATTMPAKTTTTAPTTSTATKTTTNPATTTTPKTTTSTTPTTTAKPATSATTTAPTGTTTSKAASTTGAATAAAAATSTTGPAKINSPAPDFTLTDTSGKQVSLNEFTKQGKIVVLEWFNPDCPVAKAYHTSTDTIGALAASYGTKNVTWLAINSGAPGMQGAGKERNAKAVTEYNIKYPVLLDETGKVGRMYGAKTTPHMYVIDKNGVLRYAGAIDDGSANAMGQTNYVKQALDQLIAGQPVSKAETQAFGCSVKYATE